MVKLPIFLFHRWLPKAHVEAPVYGSIVLAGVILKLGGYGLVKASFITFSCWVKIYPFLSPILIIGIIISRVYCLFLRDLKAIIAISSVRHMTYFLAGMGRIVDLSFKGGVMIMVSHGILSPLLFFFLYSVYQRVKSRRIIVSKNSFSYSLSSLLILICSANFRVPPSLNFFSEIILSISLFSISYCFLCFLLIYIIIRTCYSILIFVNLSSRNFKNFSLKNLNLVEIKLIAPKIAQSVSNKVLANICGKFKT